MSFLSYPYQLKRLYNKDIPLDVLKVSSRIEKMGFFNKNLQYYLNFKKNDLILQKEMLTYSIPLIATVVGWWVNSTADKYVVAFLIGVSANDILSVSYKIPQIINTFQGVFIQAWQISAIKEYESNEKDLFYGEIFAVINFVMCLVCSLLIIFTRPLSKILYAKEFYQAWQYVPFLLLSSVLNCAAGLLGPILTAKKNTKAMLMSALVGAGTNVVLNIILVRYIGIQGATIATVFCSYIIYDIRKRAVGSDIYIKNYYEVLVSWILLFLQAYIECYLKNSLCFEIPLLVVLLLLNRVIVKKVILFIKEALINN